MARYLIIANQTAETHELRAEVRAIAQRDPGAAFTLVVPATPVSDLLVPVSGDTAEVTRQHAESASRWLSDGGSRTVEAQVGDADPYTAAASALGRTPDCAGIVVATLPSGISAWVDANPGEVDLIARLHALVPGTSITHVVAESAVPALE